MATNALDWYKEYKQGKELGGVLGKKDLKAAAEAGVTVKGLKSLQEGGGQDKGVTFDEKGQTFFNDKYKEYKTNNFNIAEENQEDTAESSTDSTVIDPSDSVANQYFAENDPGKTLSK